jgi:hypothetical protein
MRDVYGASGDLDEGQIRDRLIATIHGVTNYAYRDNLIPVETAAGLILGVWEDKDRDVMEYLDKVVTLGKQLHSLGQDALIS